MSHKLQANGVTLKPKDIIGEMRVQWGLECLYGKAWQAKEYAKRLIFGPPEESFQLLPSYFYILEQENPDTVTVVATDEAQRFKYCFWSYGACIWGGRVLWTSLLEGHGNPIIFLPQYERRRWITHEFIVFFNKCKCEAVELCVDYYKTTILMKGYVGSILPIGHLNEWDIPLHVKQIVVLLPPCRFV
ncbi:Uncharacterized protein TCM_004334 [Theobroma cacao]|uniref:Uncharacterized protein n=1 Tax=Theobroma cacao TaxID=3641 RepID=A0A061DXL1_THECC|nr:Uncharacterized protein TCM_004334 [Theobroma cacao]